MKKRIAIILFVGALLAGSSIFFYRLYRVSAPTEEIIPRRPVKTGESCGVPEDFYAKFSKESGEDSISGVKYFVSPGGSDEAGGITEDAPLGTIQRAIELAQPGDAVVLAPGEYRQDIITVRSGDKGAPITVKGPREAIIKGNGEDRVVEINHDYITLYGFTVDGLRGSPEEEKGYRDKLVYVLGKEPQDGVNGLRLLRMSIKNAGGECVRLRYFAHDNEIAFNDITNCGVHDFVFAAGGKNGEGIYVGTAPEQLKDGKNPTTDRDESNGNWIHDNNFDTQGNECVDVKEGSSGNVIEKNKCTGQKDSESGGMGSRGSGNIFRDNEIFGNLGAGIRIGGDKKTDGVDNSICNNSIRDNRQGGIDFHIFPQGRICGNDFQNNDKGNYRGDKSAELKKIKENDVCAK